MAKAEAEGAPGGADGTIISALISVLSSAVLSSLLAIGSTIGLLIVLIVCWRKARSRSAPIEKIAVAGEGAELGLALGVERHAATRMAMPAESSDISWVETAGVARDSSTDINKWDTWWDIDNDASVAERITAEVYGDDGGGKEYVEEGGGEGRSYKPKRGLVGLKSRMGQKAIRMKVPSEDDHTARLEDEQESSKRAVWL